MHRFPPDSRRQTGRFFERDAKAVFAGVTDGHSDFGNRLCGIAEQRFGFFQPQLGEVGLEGHSDDTGEKRGRIGRVYSQFARAVAQGDGLAVVLLNAFQQAMHELFRVRLRRGAAWSLRRYGQVALEHVMQTRLFFFQGENGAPGVGQVGLAQFGQAGELHVLNNELQQPGSPDEFKLPHRFHGVSMS